MPMGRRGSSVLPHLRACFRMPNTNANCIFYMSYGYNRLFSQFERRKPDKPSYRARRLARLAFHPLRSASCTPRTGGRNAHSNGSNRTRPRIPHNASRRRGSCFGPMSACSTANTACIREQCGRVASAGSARTSGKSLRRSIAIPPPAWPGPCTRGTQSWPHARRRRDRGCSAPYTHGKRRGCHRRTPQEQHDGSRAHSPNKMDTGRSTRMLAGRRP
mmetsp:Transcript_101328/g.291952  ORF Transcript_101328/g.291952 Transcript_101328/m.291952 type:complete len:217 (+) Transcript_101328:658-1308(+)